MRPRGQSPGLPTVDELPSEENSRLAEAQRRIQTAYQRPRVPEDYQTLPPQGRFDPRPPRSGWDDAYAPLDDSQTPPQPFSRVSSATRQESGAPYKSRIHPPQSSAPTGQYEQLVGAFQSSMKDLTSRMDRSFQQMSSKLYQMSRRLDTAKDQVEAIEHREIEEREAQPMPELKKSYIHPPAFTIAATQTVSNAEVQASEPSFQRRPPEAPPRSLPKAASFQPLPREPATKDFETQTPVERSAVQEEMIDQLTTMWLETLDLLKANNLKAAYRKVLETGDDIYLLRLIHKTGVCLKDLDVTTGLTVIRRLGQIMHSYFLESLGLQWIEETVQKGVFQQLPGDVQKGLVDALYALSAMPNDEGVAAAQLYTYLTSPPA